MVQMYQRWTEDALTVVLYVYLKRKEIEVDQSRMGLARDIGSILDYSAESIYRALVGFLQLDCEEQGEEVPYQYLPPNRIVVSVWKRYSSSIDRLHEKAIAYLVENPEAMLRSNNKRASEPG